MCSRFVVIQNRSLYLCLCLSTHTSFMFIHLQSLLTLYTHLSLCHLLSCTATPRAIFARCTATSHSPKLACFQVTPRLMSLFVVCWCVFPLFCYFFHHLGTFPLIVTHACHLMTPGSSDLLPSLTTSLYFALHYLSSL